MTICSLLSHFSFLMCVVSQAAGPSSRELRHDSDLCRLVAGGCDSQRKGKGEREGKGRGNREGSQWQGGWVVIDGMPVPLLTQGGGDERLAVNTRVTASLNTLLPTETETHWSSRV